MRDLKRYGWSSGQCGRLIHFLDPNHENRATTIMPSACSRDCGGRDLSAFARGSNVVDNALMDPLYNRSCVCLREQGVRAGAWRVGMRPIAALIQQLRQRAPGRASCPPWLLDGGAGARAVGSNQPIHAAVEVLIDKSMRLQELGDFRQAPIGAVARPLNEDRGTY